MASLKEFIFGRKTNEYDKNFLVPPIMDPFSLSRADYAFRQLSLDKNQFPRLVRELHLPLLEVGSVFRASYTNRQTGEWTYRWFAVGSAHTDNQPAIIFTPELYSKQGPTTPTGEKLELTRGGWGTRYQPITTEHITVDGLFDAIPLIYPMDTTEWKPGNICMVRGRMTQKIGDADVVATATRLRHA